MKRYVDVLVLVALVLLGGSAYLTWTTADPGAGRPVVELNGSAVTDAPVTIALAALVAAVVLRLAGKVTRWLLALLLVVLGAAAVAVGGWTRPDAEQLARLRPELSQLIGIGSGPAPWLAVGGGVALVAAGLITLLTARTWRAPAARFERDRAVADTDPWRAIDAGEDPTV